MILVEAMVEGGLNLRDFCGHFDLHCIRVDIRSVYRWEKGSSGQFLRCYLWVCIRNLSSLEIR